MVVQRVVVFELLNTGLIDDMSFPPHPSAPGGGGAPGHSGRRVGKLYLAGVAARAAAARCKEDRTNVLLALTKIKLNHQLHQIAKFATNIAVVRSQTSTHLPRPIRQ